MKLVLIDLDDTLIDRSGAFTKWCAEFVEANGLDQSAMACLHDYDNRSFRSREDFADLVEHEFGLGIAQSDFLLEYRSTMTVNTRLYDGVADGLVVLRDEGWKIWIVTNGEVPVQESKIGFVSLGDMIDGWVISAAVGLRKPGREIFDLARQRAGGASESDTWMVGDNEDADIAGGHNAGLRTAWVSHSRRWPHADWNATMLRVDTVSALAEIVKRGR